jgi:hypothetical protein
LPLVLVFTGTYYALLTLVSLTNPTPVVEMFREPFVHSALFLACFMLTDPPTSPGRTGDQIWYGVLVAQACVIAQLAGAGQAFLLLGLLLGNATLAAREWSDREGAARPRETAPLSHVGGKGDTEEGSDGEQQAGDLPDDSFPPFSPGWRKGLGDRGGR